MSETNSNQLKIKLTRILWLGAGIAILWLVMYAWFYQVEPLSRRISPYWNDKVLDILTLLPAICAAVIGLVFTRQFSKGEPPRLVWLTFTIGWWCWVAGEIAGLVYDYYYWYVPYPELTLIDLCWILGYLFFGLSLFFQFRLIYGKQKNNGLNYYFAILAAGLAVTFGLTQLVLHFGLGEGLSWFALFVAVIYPVFDIAEGAAALHLSFLFRRGRWGRPWWGLIAFAIADTINIFFWIGGDQWLSYKASQSLDLISNVFYVAGYLIVALALLANYFIVRFGPINRNPHLNIAGNT